MPAVEDLVMRMRAVGARQAAREVEQTAASTKRVGKAAAETSRSYKSAGREAGVFSGRLKGVIGLGKSAALALGVFGLAGSIKSVVTSGEEWQQVQRQTAATLKATGAAAWTNRKAIEEMAASIGDATAVNRDNIQSSANMLLTFRNIKGPKMFEASLRSIVNMQAQFHKAGKDTTKVPVMIGKAMNDPVKGITALRRVGVAFTDQQQEQIKALAESGQRMKAQKMILRELNREFKAPRPTPWQQLQYSLQNLRREIGIALLPTVNKIIRTLAKFVSGIEHNTGAGGKLRGVVTHLVSELKSLFKWVGHNKDVVEALATAVAGAWVGYKLFMGVSKMIGIYQKMSVAIGLLTGATTAEEAAQMGLNAAMIANPVGLIVIAIAALIAVLVLAYMKVKWFRDGVKAVVKAVVGFVKQHWKLLLAIMLGPFGLVLLGIIKFRKQIWHVIKTLVGGIVNFFKAIPSGVKGIFNGVINFFIRRINDLIGIINSAIKGYNAIPLVPNIGLIPKIAQLGGKKKAPSGPVHNAFGATIGSFATAPRGRDWAGLGSMGRMPAAHGRAPDQHIHMTVESPIHLDGRLIGKAVRKASVKAKAAT